MFALAQTGLKYTQVTAIAIKASGISCVIAPSFARIFYRNAINMGLAIMESREASEAIKGGDEVEVNFETGEIKDLTSGQSFIAKPFPEFIRKIIEADGLVGYIAK